MSRQLEFEFSYGKKLPKPRASVDVAHWHEQFDDLFADSMMNSARETQNVVGKIPSDLKLAQDSASRV